MSIYRAQFEAALRLLASAFAEVAAAGYGRPVLVGGGAVEYYTGGEITSGDFDVITPAQKELERALLKRGFIRPSGPGTPARGVYHPELDMGVEVVSGILFDGAADRERVRLVDVGAGEPIPIPAVEDMIADRMGQFNTRPGGDPAMLRQAIVLYLIACQDMEYRIDSAYLEKRIRQETNGDYGLAYLTEKANEA
ncbi:MAG TPA: hypothetical protein VKY65_14810 [Alphaproteobacteria bacterium]|nr:hypothetical protein [Alphaproteobacteria bacterium]